MRVVDSFPCAHAIFTLANYVIANVVRTICKRATQEGESSPSSETHLLQDPFEQRLVLRVDVLLLHALPHAGKYALDNTA